MQEGRQSQNLFLVDHSWVEHDGNVPYIVKMYQKNFGNVAEPTKRLNLTYFTNSHDIFTHVHM